MSDDLDEEYNDMAVNCDYAIMILSKHHNRQVGVKGWWKYHHVFLTLVAMGVRITHRSKQITSFCLILKVQIFSRYGKYLLVKQSLVSKCKVPRGHKSK